MPSEFKVTIHITDIEKDFPKAVIRSAWVSPLTIPRAKEISEFIERIEEAVGNVLGQGAEVIVEMDSAE